LKESFTPVGIKLSYFL